MLTCQHAGEEHGWKVVMEVKDPAHEEEWEVMEHPAQQELTTSLQQHLGQAWAQAAQPQSADSPPWGAETLGSSPALPFLAV